MSTIQKVMQLPTTGMQQAPKPDAMEIARAIGAAVAGEVIKAAAVAKAPSLPRFMGWVDPFTWQASAKAIDDSAFCISLDDFIELVATPEDTWMTEAQVQRLLKAVLIRKRYHAKAKALRAHIAARQAQQEKLA